MDLKLDKVDLSNIDLQLEVYKLTKSWGRQDWVENPDVFEIEELIPFIKEVQPKFQKLAEAENILLDWDSATNFSTWVLAQGRRYYLTLRGKIEKLIFSQLSCVKLNGSTVYFVADGTTLYSHMCYCWMHEEETDI